jgi:rhodanese-related sulfurtransferase
MPNPFGAPEVSVSVVSQKLKAGDRFVWLDVREPHELAQANFRDDNVLLAPISQLALRGIEALPLEARNKEAEIVISCHHGIRSAQVAAWLLQQGWRNVASLEGGIDAWARQIDPNVGTY